MADTESHLDPRGSTDGHEHADKERGPRSQQFVEVALPRP